MIICIGLSVIGISATEVEEIIDTQWRDLGMPETLWHCRVKEFGSLMIIQSRDRVLIFIIKNDTQGDKFATLVIIVSGKESKKYVSLNILIYNTFFKVSMK